MKQNTMSNTPSKQQLAEMQADAILPDDIQPIRHPKRPVTVAFVTGSTGFLGRYVVKSLLQHTTLHLNCLVRGDSVAHAQKRLWDVLEKIGLYPDQINHRITVLCGRIDQEYFALEAVAYEKLANEVGCIYHCAAMVNWARSYRKLRAVNMLGTLLVIRFACHLRLKSLIFVSSIAVCYASDRQALVTEQTDMMPHVAHMPLGYAQSKCVAESLLRQAAQRGLSVTILRPGLIGGDTETGVSNTEDFVAALLDGCTRLGIAIDADWLLDFVPVDCVANVIAKLPLYREHKGRAETLHLLAQQPCGWRELILWLNLSGYPIKLVPNAQWLAEAFIDRQKTGDRLYLYRYFFQGLPHIDPKLKPFEVYLQSNQQLIESHHSEQYLAAAGLNINRLDAALMQGYLNFFQAQGVLLKPSRHIAHAKNNVLDEVTVLDILNQQEPCLNLNIDQLNELPLDSKNGILNQLAAAQGGSAIGLRAYRVTHDSHCDIVVKTKCNDDMVIDATVQMASLCNPSLGAIFNEFRSELGLSGTQQREAALYTLDAPTLRKHTPLCYGTQHDSKTDITTIVLEKIKGVEKRDEHYPMGCWSHQQIHRVIDGLTQIQLVDQTLLKPLIESGLLTHERKTSLMLKMTPLWEALVTFAAEQSKQAKALLPLQLNHIHRLSEWWPALLEQPQTLIHNDFNPRNLVLCSDGDEQIQQLCVYDWELALIGAPQHDLAEFLCFVVNPEKNSLADINALVMAHYWLYVNKTKQSVSVKTWQQGFNLALRQFVITRLPMYALMNRFRPQAFLPQVNKNALWLMRL